MRLLEWDERPVIRSGEIPSHVAAIMDGNRRWAAPRGIPPEAAHQAVELALTSFLEEAAYMGVEHVTLFALSPRNLLRSSDEVASLKQLRSWLWTPEVIKTLNGIGAKVQLIGETNVDWIEDAAIELEQLTRPAAPTITVNFAINHSAKAELRAALVENADAAPTEFSVPAARAPDIDLLIRTGGEQRLSDFMLMALGDAELLFTDTLWPDFRALHLASSIAEYQQRRRRFGR